MTTSALLSTDVATALAAYRTCEFATVSRSGTPIPWPITTLPRPDGSFLLTTSIGAPQKAFNVRRNPAVAMLFSDPTASGLVAPPQVLVQGTADCPDEIVTDIRAHADYWTRLFRWQPGSRSYGNSAISRWLMDFYYQRLIITVTPVTVATRPPASFDTPLTATGLRRTQQSTPFGQAARRLPGYRSAVLAAFDAAGRPTLLRVRPVADVSSAQFLMDVAGDADLRPGRASLLCHSHDLELGSLRSFVVAGTLARHADGWSVTPDRFIPGIDRLGPISGARMFRGLRSAARRYLDRRGLDRPAIPWDDIRELASAASV